MTRRSTMEPKKETYGHEPAGNDAEVFNEEENKAE